MDVDDSPEEAAIRAEARAWLESVAKRRGEGGGAWQSFRAKTDVDDAARRLRIPTMLVRGRMSDLVSEETARHFLATNEDVWTGWVPAEVAETWRDGLHVMRLVVDGSRPAEVVAVIDGGVDTAHVDLRGQLWRNADETPGKLG